MACCRPPCLHYSAGSKAILRKSTCCLPPTISGLLLQTCTNATNVSPVPPAPQQPRRGVALKSIHNFYMHEVTEALPSFKPLQWLLLPSFLHGLLPEARVTGARNVAVFQMDPVAAGHLGSSGCSSPPRSSAVRTCLYLGSPGLCFQPRNNTKCISAHCI